MSLSSVKSETALRSRLFSVELVDLAVGQTSRDRFHVWVLALSATESEQLLAKVDALLPSQIRLFHVASCSIDAMAGRTHSHDGGRTRRLSKGRPESHKNQGKANSESDALALKNTDN